MTGELRRYASGRMDVGSFEILYRDPGKIAILSDPVRRLGTQTPPF
jgi:hypothetical protein